MEPYRPFSPMGALLEPPKSLFAIPLDDRDCLKKIAQLANGLTIGLDVSPKINVTSRKYFADVASAINILAEHLAKRNGLNLQTLYDPKAPP